MTEKRLIVDEDYNWVDTTTGMCVEVEDAFDLVDELAEENEQLKFENRQLKGRIMEYEEQIKELKE